MRVWLLLALMAASDVALAGDSPTPSDAALDRGLAFLAKDALAWKADHNCVSCHHASLVVWAMQEAKQKGRPVDEPVMAEMAKWMAEAGDGRVGLERPKDRPKAFNSKALMFAVGLATVPNPDETVKAGMAKMI